MCSGGTRVCTGGMRVCTGGTREGNKTRSVLEGEGEGVYLGKERVSFRDKADH